MKKRIPLLYVIIALLVLEFVLSPLLFPYSQVAQAQATGWLQGWEYRRAVTINNTQNSNALTDYQVLVVVDTASLISAGKLQGTCADIRLTDSDGATLLNYWIEPNTCNTSSTRIWVKVPSIPASSTKTIYLYYGNSSASSAENGDATFLLFDDFLDTSLNTSKWTWFFVAGHNDCYKYTVAVSNGLLTIEAQTDDYSSPFCIIAVQSLKTFNYPVAIHANLSAPNWGGTGSAGYYRSAEYGFQNDTSSAESNTFVFVSYNEWGRKLTASTAGTSSSTNDYTSLNPTLFHYTVVVWVPGSSASWYVNNALAGLLSSNVPPSTYSLPVEFRARHWGTTSYPSGKLVIDLVFVRKYTDPEPTTSVSATEEVAPPPPPTLNSPSNGFRVNPGASVNFTWTYNPAFSGDYQTAFQLQISNSTAFTTLFYDTGQVPSGNTYAVITLPSNMTVGTYYWRVRVWSSQNPASDWSSAYKLIVDVIVVTLSVNDTRTDVGSYVNISWVLKFKSDSSSITNFSITVNRNGTSWYSGSASYALDTSPSVLAYTYSVASVKDNTYGVTAFEANTVTTIWDQVVVNSFAPSKPRFTVGDPPSFNISAVYAFDGTPFQGSFTLNDTSTKTTVGAYGYAITAVSDPLYGLTRFSGNTTTSVIFDKLVLSSYSFVLNNNVLTNGSRIDYSYPSVNLTATFTHAYDGLPLNSTYGAVVQLVGLNASWNGSAWIATIPSPGAITARNYQVATNVQSTLNVRFVDASPIFRIIYDSVNSTYTTDLASNTIFIRSVYGYDGSPLPSGIACINDAGSLSCGSISNGVASIPFNRFTNGTVVFVNANDTAFVFSNPAKPDKLVVKWVSSDKSISLVGTVDAYLINTTSLPGYLRILSELRGNASVLVNTSLTPVFVKVNGAPATFNYTNGYVLLYNLGSQVEVYYSIPSSPGIMPGSAPIGAIYEIGFADNSYLQNATFKLGILVNGSAVTPFVEINGSRTYGSGVAGLFFPLVTDLSWGCPDNRPAIYYRTIYVVGDKTMSYTSSYKFDTITYTCPATLYPYIYIPGSIAGVVDKYGSVLSELLKYLATGVARITVLGGVMPGSLVEYIILNSPVTIQFNGSAVTPTQGGTAPLTLVGFRGYTLSYSVAGVTVSNILVSSDPFTLNFPYGIALMVITDPSSRTVNIVQVSVPQQTINYTWPTSTSPSFATPSLPSISFKPQLTFTWDSPTFIVLYGSMVAVAILASRIAGSILRGIMMASVAYGFVFIGIGAFTGNLQPVMLGLLAFIVAVAMEVARRNAG